MIVAIWCGAAVPPVCESLSYKHRTHSSPPSNNGERASRRELTWEKQLIFNSALILSIRALLSQFTNVHHACVMLTYNKISESLEIVSIASQDLHCTFFYVRYNFLLKDYLRHKFTVVSNVKCGNGSHVFMHIPSSLPPCVCLILFKIVPRF